MRQGNQKLWDSEGLVFHPVLFPSQGKKKKRYQDTITKVTFPCLMKLNRLDAILPSQERRVVREAGTGKEHISVAEVCLSGLFVQPGPLSIL